MPVILKKGDDLRQDILTLQIFKVMKRFWFESGLKLKMSIYEVTATGFFQGMLEVVENSVTLAEVHKEYGGMQAGLSSKPLSIYFEEKLEVSEMDSRRNFLLSCVAYCVATFVLGIGDRHNDNIMVKSVGV